MGLICLFLELVSLEESGTRSTPPRTPGRPKRRGYFIASNLDDGGIPWASEKITEEWKTTIVLSNPIDSFVCFFPPSLSSSHLPNIAGWHVLKSSCFAEINPILFPPPSFWPVMISGLISCDGAKFSSRTMAIQNNLVNVCSQSRNSVDVFFPFKLRIQIKESRVCFLFHVTFLETQLTLFCVRSQSISNR